MSNGERSQTLMNVAHGLQSHLEGFACREALDCGKLFPSVMSFEAPSAVDAFACAAGMVRCLEGRVVSIAEPASQGKAEAARLVAGGVPYRQPDPAAGNFVPPTVFADVRPTMKIFQQEIFGPVLCVSPFRTEDEAVELANGVAYGLAAGVFTRDVGRAHRVAARLHAGQVYVNSYFSNGIMEAPTTGWKESGIGDAGIRTYLHPKAVFVNLGPGRTGPTGGASARTEPSRPSGLRGSRGAGSGHG